jgi:hypothetical protein
MIPSDPSGFRRQVAGNCDLGSVLLVLHQAGNRFFDDPDGNAWIVHERPGRA